jgi:6-phosphogluconolactonase
MSKLKSNWIVFKDDNQLVNALAERILVIAKESIRSKGSFSIVLAGGDSAKKLYKKFKDLNSDWNRWVVYFGDERCSPVGSCYRNDKTIMDLWLDSSSIPKCNIFPIKSELETLEACLDYENILKKVDTFDVVLLSVGEDGHTASLFPKHKYAKNTNVVLELDSPKLPLKRISMSYSRLNNSNYVFKMVMGKSKRKMVDLWMKEEVLPISLINGSSEEVYMCKDTLPKKL